MFESWRRNKPPWWNGRHATLKMLSRMGCRFDTDRGYENYQNMKSETIKKIANCKALQNVTVSDICESERFLSNLSAYIRAQREDREAIRASYNAMRKLGGAKGYKLPSHPIDHCINMTEREFAAEYMALIHGTCKRSASERKYIEQLCAQAYRLTVGQIICEEYPELKSEFFPKNN